MAMRDLRIAFGQRLKNSGSKGSGEGLVTCGETREAL